MVASSRSPLRRTGWFSGSICLALGPVFPYARLLERFLNSSADSLFSSCSQVWSVSPFLSLGRLFLVPLEACSGGTQPPCAKSPHPTLQESPHGGPEVSPPC
jgi:hypothetical protein